MEKKKQIVMLTDIENYFRKEERKSVLSFCCIFLFFCWLAFIIKITIIKIIMIVICLLTLWGVAWSLYNLLQIRNNTYFKLRTDELISKADNIYTLLHGGNTHRLYFRQDHYDLWINNINTGLPLWSKLHDMENKTIYDTAFVGDVFTLVSVGKRVSLVFNNKFFEIQNDL